MRCRVVTARGVHGGSCFSEPWLVKRRPMRVALLDEVDTRQYGFARKLPFAARLVWRGRSRRTVREIPHNPAALVRPSTCASTRRVARAPRRSTVTNVRCRESRIRTFAKLPFQRPRVPSRTIVFASVRMRLNSTRAGIGTPRDAASAESSSRSRRLSPPLSAYSTRRGVASKHIQQQVEDVRPHVEEHAAAGFLPPHARERRQLPGVRVADLRR